MFVLYLVCFTASIWICSGGVPVIRIEGPSAGKEGRSLTLKAVTAVNASVFWANEDGDIISSNETLHFSKLTRENGMAYRVYATDGQHTYFRVFRLSILTPPKVIGIMQNNKLVTGRKVICYEEIICKFLVKLQPKTTPPFRIFVYLDSSKVTDEKQRDPATTFSFGKRFLRNDTGRNLIIYAHGSYGGNGISKLLDVYYGPIIHLKESESNITTYVTSNITITPSVESNPLVTKTYWTRNGTTISTSYLLSLTNIQLEQGGDYIFHASNAGAISNKTIHIEVYREIAIKHVRVNDNIMSPTQKEIILRDNTVETFQFFLEDGIEFPYFINVYLDEKLVSTANNSQNYFSLIPDRSWNGKTLEANISNVRSFFTFRMPLLVFYGPDLTFTPNKSVFYIHENEPFNVSANIDSRPTVGNFHWVFRDNKHTYRIIHYDPLLASDAVKREEAGYYTAVAEGIKTRNLTFQLIVLYPPSSRLTKLRDGVLLCQIQPGWPSDFDYRIHQTINGIEVRQNITSIRNKYDVQALYDPQLLKDGGRYICEVSNVFRGTKVGETTSSLNIQSRSKPVFLSHLPTLSVNESEPITIVLQFLSTPPYEYYYWSLTRYNFQTNSMQEINITQSGNTSISYANDTIAIDNNPVILIKQTNKSMVFYNTSVVVGIYEASLNIQHAKEANSGLYTLCVSNSEGFVTKSVAVLVRETIKSTQHSTHVILDTSTPTLATIPPKTEPVTQDNTYNIIYIVCSAFGGLVLGVLIAFLMTKFRCIYVIKSKLVGSKKSDVTTNYKHNVMYAMENPVAHSENPNGYITSENEIITFAGSMVRYNAELARLESEMNGNVNINTDKREAIKNANEDVENDYSSLDDIGNDDKHVYELDDCENSFNTSNIYHTPQSNKKVQL